MAGGESSRAMTTILRNNRNLLRKKNIFKKDRTFLSTRKEYYKAAKGELNLKKASKKDLLLIRKKIIKQRRLDSLIGWTLVTVFLGLILIFGIYAYNKSSVDIIEQNETNKEIYLDQNLNEYTFLLEDGDKWIKEKNWNNAIYRYEQAVKLFPEEFESNYRLALAYSYNCEYKNEDCEIGKKLTNKLLFYAPQDKNLLELQNLFTK